MSKTINISIKERTVALALLSDGKFNNVQLAVVLEDIKKIAVSPEEWEKANLVKTPQTNGQETWTWTEEGSEKDIELGQETVDFLKNQIKTKSDAGELSVQDGALLSLDKKL